MNLRFFVDQCVPRSVFEALITAGHDVSILRNHLPINAKDPEVIACAQSLKAILVTLNGDFADIINYPPKDFGGIIALQIKNHPESLRTIIMRLLTHLTEHPQNDAYIGKLLLVESHRIRIKE